MENNSSGFITGVIVTLIAVSLFWGIGSYGKYEGQTAKEWYDDYDYSQANLDQCESSVEDYQYTIDDANYMIEEAKSYAWENYDDMGYALENLETIDEP